MKHFWAHEGTAEVATGPQSALVPGTQVLLPVGVGLPEDPDAVSEGPDAVSEGPDAEPVGVEPVAPVPVAVAGPEQGALGLAETHEQRAPTDWST